jgi:hypothetical protein
LERHDLSDQLVRDDPWRDSDQRSLPARRQMPFSPCIDWWEMGKRVAVPPNRDTVFLARELSSVLPVTATPLEVARPRTRDRNRDYCKPA